MNSVVNKASNIQRLLEYIHFLGTLNRCNNNKKAFPRKHCNLATSEETKNHFYPALLWR